MLDPLPGMHPPLILILAHERVRVLPLHQIAQRVVHLAMLGLIGADIQDQIPNAPLPLRHIPVADGDLGSLGGLKERQVAGVDLGDEARVGDDGLLLEVADEAVARARRDEVGEEERVVPHPLRGEQHRAHEAARLRHGEEREQVHALVVGLFEEGLDPPVVALQPPDRVQVPQGCGHHAGDAGDRLEEDAPDQPFALVHGRVPPCAAGVGGVLDAAGHGVVVRVAGEEVHAHAEEAHHRECDFVGESIGAAVGDGDVVHLLFGVAVGR